MSCTWKKKTYFSGKIQNDMCPCLIISSDILIFPTLMKIWIIWRSKFTFLRSLIWLQRWAGCWKGIPLAWLLFALHSFFTRFCFPHFLQIAPADSLLAKGTVNRMGALKILALPKRGGGSHPSQDLFGGFDIVYRGQPNVIMDPQTRQQFPRKW